MTAPTSELGRLLTASDAARRLGISDDRIRRLIATGEMTAVRHPNGRLAGVYEADALAWRERARVATTTTAAPTVSHDVDDAVDALLEPHERIFG